MPWFWVDERKGEVHVDTSKAPSTYPIRIKNETRRDVLSIDDGCHRIHVRDLYFYGTSCCGAGPEYNSLQSTDLRLTRSRFLYAPADGIRLKSTKQTKRGGTPYVKFENNTAEFGEGALLCGNQPVRRVSWLGRVARNRHRHAIEQASRRWRGGRRDDSERAVKF